MIEELYVRHEQLEAQLLEDDGETNMRPLQRELAHVEDLLGLRIESVPLKTGDVVTDYLIRKQLSGEITPEDLERTPEEIREIVAEEERKLHRGRV